jgi:hypothetical protein
MIEVGSFEVYFFCFIQAAFAAVTLVACFACNNIYICAIYLLLLRN